ASFFSGTRSQTYKLDTPPVHSHRNEKKRQRTPTPQAKCGLQIHRKHEIGRNKGPRSRVSPSAAEDISSRVTFQDELDFTVRIEPSHLVTFDHDGRGDPRPVTVALDVHHRPLHVPNAILDGASRQGGRERDPIRGEDDSEVFHVPE